MEAVHTAPQDAAEADGSSNLPLSGKQLKLTLGGIMLAMFLASLDQTIVSTALPKIVGDLGGFDRFTWVTTAYIVASTSVVPIAGSLADVFGRKWLYVFGISVFLVGSALAGTSQSMNALIIFRAVQGVGGGIMMALSIVTIGDLFPPKERGKYQGLIAGMFGISSVLGPTLGGFLTDSLSWHWIFYVNLPLGIPVVILFIRLFPESRKSLGRKVDIPGALLLLATVVPLLLGLTWGGSQYPWGSVQVLTVLTVAVVAGIALIWVESRVEQPILPFHLYRQGVIGISLAASFFSGFAMFGAITFIPLLFQGVLGASATESGSFMTPMMLGMVAGAAVSGQLISRLGGHYRNQGLVGLLIMAGGVFLLSRVSENTGYGTALTGAIIMGIGLGSTFPLFTIAVQNAAPKHALGAATSGIQFFRSIGGSIGLALLGSVMINRFKGGVETRLGAGSDIQIPGLPIEELSNNPNALISADAVTDLQAQIVASGTTDPGAIDTVLNALKAALAGAISDIFLIALVLLIVAIVITLFLKEKPLRDE